MENKDKEYFIKYLIRLIESENGLLIECFSLKEIKKPLIYKDWKGTGGKLGYKPLAKKYNLTISEIRTICSKFNK